MSFQFPNAPTNGQIFTDVATGAQYVFQSPAWMQSSAAQIKLSAQPRSRIVNGAMQHSQENGDTSGTSQTYYLADQFRHSMTGAGVFTGQRVALATPNKSKHRLRTQVSTADAALATTDQYALLTYVEGSYMADFGWGAAGARQAVLRFGFKAPAGTYFVSIRNGDIDRSWVAPIVISAAQANADTEQVFVIPGDTTGAWATAAGAGMHLTWCVASGPDRVGVAGWQAGNKTAGPGGTNGAATNGLTYEVFDVGLYLDPNATGAAPPWEMPDEAEELAACQRYFQWTPHDQTIWSATPGATYSNTSLLPVVMRAAPALSVAVVGTPVGGANAASSSATAFRMQYVLFTGTAGALTVSISGRAYYLNARM